jgi:hypothetical protein
MYAEDRDLGIALPAVGSAISAIGGLFGGSKDDGRLKSNADAYNMALSNPLGIFKDQGVQPTAFLLMKSPTAKGGQGGWATSKAQNDAYAKYTSAMNTLKSRGYTFNSDGSVNPPVSGTYPSSTGNPAGTAGGPPITSAGLGIPGGNTLLYASIAGLGLLLLSRKR